MILPEKCCAKCCWWAPNQGAKVSSDEDKKCHEPHQKKAYTVDEHWCKHFLSSTNTDVNVPAHTPKGTMNFKNATPVSGSVEILIVTYAKDFPWLELALKCIRKHARGFSGVTIVVPNRAGDRASMARESIIDGIRERWVFFNEAPGKGFLHHEVMMASADELVPAGTNFVMHMDADCMMKMSNTPEDYFLNDKPIYIWRTWDSLSSPDPYDPRKKVVSDCIMWKEPTAKQVGFHSEAYTMCRHPTVFPIEFYKPYRDHVANHHKMSFEQYMLSGKQNMHPQDRMDLTAMGQVAYQFMRDKFHWINCATEEYPADRMKAYHSHSGFVPGVLEEINSFLT